MKIGQAVAASFLFLLIIVIGLLAWGLASGGSFSVPGFVELADSGSADHPETSLSFSPVGPLVLVAVSTLLLWGAPRVVRARR